MPLGQDVQLEWCCMQEVGLGLGLGFNFQGLSEMGCCARFRIKVVFRSLG